jgi:hypothetical protein
MQIKFADSTNYARNRACSYIKIEALIFREIGLHH